MRHAPAKWTCNLDGGLPNRDGLSSIDRKYLDKVRAKLLNPRQMAKAAGRDPAPDQDSDAETLLTSSLPDDEDMIDDILFDRSPKNENQVRIFGGWLDDAVAGRKANKDIAPAESAMEGPDDADASVRSHRRASLSTEDAVNSAQALFAQAMFLFNKGQYRRAIEGYAEAVKVVGLGSRLGGEYQLWCAQALDAAGEKAAAANMLEGLRNHADADVRKVSRELHFIVTVPALDLDPGSFLDVPSIDDVPVSRSIGILTSNFGPLRTALVEKKPEQYSLEWYMEKERPPKMKDNSMVEALLVAGAVCSTLAFMLASPS